MPEQLRSLKLSFCCNGASAQGESFSWRFILTHAGLFCSQGNGEQHAKNMNALRFGVLGAARIAPEALLKPARTHPDVVVIAVACRDKERGHQYARKHHIPRTFSGPTAYHGGFFYVLRSSTTYRAYWAYRTSGRS